MCRGSHQGGRRCPGQSSSAAKKAAANRRKNNRRAKKNVKKFFTDQGMNDTADAVDDMTPSQIPSLLDALGIDSSVLGDVETPVSVHAPAEKRSAEEIIQIATQEAKDKGITAVNVHVDPDDDGVPTQEQLKNSLLDLVAKTTQSDYFSDYLSVLDCGLNEFPEDLEKVYSLMNKMDLSDDFDERNDQLIALERDLNNHIIISLQPDVLENSLLISNAVIEGNPAPDNDVTKEIVDQLPDDINGIYALYKLSMGEATARDFGGGLYYVEDNKEKDDPYGGYNYLYAPNGFDDLTDVVTSPKIWSAQKPHNISSTILYGGGITGLDKDKIAELIQDHSFSSAINKFIRISSLSYEGYTEEKKLAYVSDTVNHLLTEISTVDVPEINHHDIEDLHVSHRLARSGTFVQSELGMDISPDSPQYVEKVRKFRMGLLPQETIPITGKAHELSETLMSISVNPGTVEDDEETRKNHEPEVTSVGEFLSKKIVSQEVDSNIVDIIEDYTSDSYTQYALDASGIIPPEEYRPGNKKMNDFIKLYQDEVRPEPRTVFRGSRVPQGMSSNQYYDSVTVGEVVSTTKITSTSYSNRAIASFTGGNNVISVFHTRTGLPIESMSNYETEREIILPAGEEYVCVGKRYDEKRRTYVFYYADKDSVDEMTGDSNV